MADVIQSNAAARRAADSLLRSAGGRSVLLRIPSPATAGDAREQLGFAAPTFQDVELAPVLFRKALPHISTADGTRWELLVSATAVNAVVGSLTYQSGNVLFAEAFGVLVDEILMQIEFTSASQILGEPYVYRLMLRVPETLGT